RQKEAADARQRQIEIEEAKRRKELADAAEAEARRKAEVAAEAKRKEEPRVAALAEARRKTEIDIEEKRRVAALEEARRRSDELRKQNEAEAEEKRRIAALEEARRKEQAATEDKLREERRIAALEETRRTEEKRKEDERLRLAAIPDDDKRADFVRKIQVVLKRSRCYDGAVTGRSTDAQGGLDKFVDTAQKRGKPKPTHIELAKATVGDFETWLKDADAVKDGLCVPVAKPADKPAPVARPRQPERQYSAARQPSYGGGGGGNAPIQGIR